MCEDDPEEFVCILIDEVETITTTREGSAHGESQESLRATNAFLTGLDRTKKYPNIIFLCTSNMVKSLDAAFLDRCGLKVAVDLPSLGSQYAILRGRIQRLITRGIVLSNAILPSYRDAQVDRNADPELPGSKILHILKIMNSSSARFESIQGAISGRSLTQMPEQALLRYLRGEDCNLDMALKLIEKYIRAEQTRGEEIEVEQEEEQSESVSKAEENKSYWIGGELRNGKRSTCIAEREDRMIDQVMDVSRL